MSTRMRICSVLAVLCCMVIPAYDLRAGWGPSGCTVVQTASAFSGWEARSDEPHILGYFVNGVQVAGYNQKTHVFRDYDAARDKWGPPQRAPWAKADPCKSNCQCEECEDGCECPKGRACGDGRCGCIVAKKAVCPCKCGCGADCPCAEKGPCEEGCSCQSARKKVSAAPHAPGVRDCVWAEADGTMNYGLDRSKLRGGERASINGRPATKEELFEALGDPEKGGKIPDDANFLRLTVVAEDSSALAKLKATMLPLLGPLADKLAIQWYTKDNWAIRPEYGFHFDKLPAALLQAPEQPGKKGGKALFQSHIGADPAPVVAAVRQKVDGFDSKKVPGLPGLPSSVHPAVILGAIGAAGYLLLKK